MLKLSFFLRGSGEVAAVRLPGLAVRALPAEGPISMCPAEGHRGTGSSHAAEASGPLPSWHSLQWILLA